MDDSGRGLYRNEAGELLDCWGRPASAYGSDLLDMEMLDLLIIGQQRFVSLREHGLRFN
jgi:hypothetical protein